MNTQQHIAERLATEKQAFQHEKISRMWEIFEVSPDEILELRAIWPKTPGPTKRNLTRHFRRKDYKSNDECCLAFQCAAANDLDIIMRRLLLLDIDRVIDTKNPSSNEELNASKEIATNIHNFTDELRWPKPHVVMSGNGYHLYYRIADFTPNETTDDLIRRTLSNLSTVFSTDHIKVDTTVSNLSRITKVPGTIARKGTESPGRLYREAQVL